MDKRTVDVIIPTCGPDGRFEKLIRRLERQTVKPSGILVINTEEALFQISPALAGEFACGRTNCGIALFVCHISRDEFDHGGTRDRAAGMSRADVLLFMTQDAVPADNRMIERMLSHLDEGDQEGAVAAVYARQLPDKKCGPVESYARGFNYGPESMVKSARDLPRLGIKTYFCSNVCAAYVRAVYEKLGGFEKRTIFNEDMIFAARLIQNGYRVAYAADARVVHSHNYTGRQLFKRNFDLAVSQADHPEIFAAVSSKSEGMRFVKSSAVNLIRSGHFLLLPQLVWQSGCKYIGYCLGRHYRRLPRRVVELCSMNQNFWKNKLF